MKWKKAQTTLKNKLENGIKNLKDKEKKFKMKKRNNTTKKVLSPEEYKKKVNELRTKVSSLQKREILY